jgi:L-aminopeptidase/D-esterase-like protein
MVNDTITAVEGIRVGHAQIPDAPTGVTVVLPPPGSRGAVDVRGGAPGTHGTDALHPVNLVERLDGLFFAGGSGFGLAAADGVREYLRRQGIGFNSGYGRIPIVAGAIIFDLGLQQLDRLPDAPLGLEACELADTAPVAEGCVGAGAGATAGKLRGMECAMKSGLGSACIEGAGGIRVGALIVANPFGDVTDPSTGRIVAGCRTSGNALELVDADRELRNLTRSGGFPDQANTVVGVVATNAALNKVQLTKVAQMAHDGIARTVRPSHTLFDGDALFAVSSGDLGPVHVNVIGGLAAQAVAEAILHAVRKAVSFGPLPAYNDLLE